MDIKLSCTDTKLSNNKKVQKYLRDCEKILNKTIDINKINNDLLFYGVSVIKID